MKRNLVLLVLAASTTVAAAPPAKAPLLIQTESRIEVDAQGQITAIKTTPALPAEIEAILHANLRKIRFAPPMKDGRAVAGVTFATQEACAAEVDGHYGFAVKFRGNGPSMDRKHAPVYPREMERRGVESKWTVEYAIATDGSASLTGLKREEGGGNSRGDSEFRKSLTQWIETIKFQPEQLDGQPVATRMSTKVAFTLDSGTPSPDRTAKANASAITCKVALDAGDRADRAVALDSPFKPTIVIN